MHGTMEFYDPYAWARSVVDAIITPPDVSVGLAEAIDEF